MLTQKPIKTRDAVIVACILALLMVAGSIWDYPISLALYDQSNWFGNLFAAYGELPAMLALTMAGTILVAARNKEKKGLAAFQLIAGALVALLGIAGTSVMPMGYLPLGPAVIIPVGLVISILVVVLTLGLCKKADRATLIKVAAAFFIIVFAEMILVNIVKVPWERARMRLVAVDDRAEFIPWWVVGGDLKETLVAAGVEGDQFKSFPSGHTANGACMMLLALLTTVSEKLKNKQTLLFFIGAAWGLLVAFSRIIMGAHYLTDTVVGFAITLVITLIVTKLVFDRKKPVKA